MALKFPEKVEAQKSSMLYVDFLEFEADKLKK
jgi:hypothetical protein